MYMKNMVVTEKHRLGVGTYAALGSRRNACQTSFMPTELWVANLLRENVETRVVRHGSVFHRFPNLEFLTPAAQSRRPIVPREAMLTGL